MLYKLEYVLSKVIEFHKKTANSLEMYLLD